MSNKNLNKLWVQCWHTKHLYKQKHIWIYLNIFSKIDNKHMNFQNTMNSLHTTFLFISKLSNSKQIIENNNSTKL